MWYVDEFPTDSNSDDIKKKENIEVMIVRVTFFDVFHVSELWSMLQNSQFFVKFFMAVGSIPPRRIVYK